MQTSKFTWINKLLSAAVLIALYVPLFSIVFLSFYSKDPTRAGALVFSFNGFSSLVRNDSLGEAALLSVFVALVSTAFSTVLGTMLAYAIDRYEFPGKRLFESLAMAPLVLPELVLGISLLIWFVLLNMTLGQVSLILAHTTFTISYIFVSVQARLKEFDHTIEEAAYDLGANSAQTFRYVLLPILKSAIVSGAVMAFTISFDDFFIAYFTTGSGADTLPLKIYSLTKYGVTAEINALSTLILAATVFLLFFAMDTKKKTGVGF